MLRMLMGNKIASTMAMFVVLLAIYKFNDGDIIFIIDSIWNAMNNAADSLIDVWNHFFGGK